MFHLILFGPPGAGKGTQSKNIARKYGYIHISTGDILRAEIRAQSELGKRVRAFMDQGELVPDEVLLGVLREVMDREKDVNGFVWDGFPRTLVQAEAFDQVLAARGEKVNLVLALEVELHELVRRLVNRGKEDRRVDDTEDIILQRQRIYRDMTQPLIAFYREQGKFVSVSGIQPIEKVFDDICRNIDLYTQ
ncbi:MAG TPA: adenylate kinase [Bacteroidales bacterium]|nr:adenylate kinase [Bacteroidales bacterium]